MVAQHKKMNSNTKVIFIIKKMEFTEARFRISYLFSVLKTMTKCLYLTFTQHRTSPHLLSKCNGLQVWNHIYDSGYSNSDPPSFFTPIISSSIINVLDSLNKLEYSNLRSYLNFSDSKSSFESQKWVIRVQLAHLFLAMLTAKSFYLCESHRHHYC